MSERTAVLLGTPIDDVTLPEAVDRIATMIAVGRNNGRVHQVVTVNVDFVVNAAHDDELRAVLQRSDLAIPDGMGIVWGARLVGTPVRERTSGVDLVPALVERAAADGWRICLFGAAPGVADKAADLLRQRYPGASVVGMAAPAVAADGAMDPAALDVLRDTRADVVCVALGNPKQERWIVRHGDAVGAPVFIGIGGTLDFLTGVTRRAPIWMQRWGLEWVHRAASEPRRLAGRYARDLVVIIPGLLGQAWWGRSQGSAVVPRSTTTGPAAGTVELLGRTPAQVLDAAVDVADVVRLDLSALDRLDNGTLAAVVSLQRQGRRVGAEIALVGQSPSVVDSARQLGVAALLEGEPPSRPAEG